MYMAAYRSGSIYAKYLDIVAIHEDRETAVASLLIIEPALTNVQSCLAAGPDDNGRFFWSGNSHQHHNLLDHLEPGSDERRKEWSRRNQALQHRANRIIARCLPPFHEGDKVRFNEERVFPNGMPDTKRVWTVVRTVDVPKEYLHQTIHTQFVKLEGHYNEKISGYFLIHA